VIKETLLAACACLIVIIMIRTTVVRLQLSATAASFPQAGAAMIALATVSTPNLNREELFDADQGCPLLPLRGSASEGLYLTPHH
jgi:hypothetical protein